MPCEPSLATGEKQTCAFAHFQEIGSEDLRKTTSQFRFTSPQVRFCATAKLARTRAKGLSICSSRRLETVDGIIGQREQPRGDLLDYGGSMLR